MTTAGETRGAIEKTEKKKIIFYFVGGEERIMKIDWSGGCEDQFQ